MPVLTGTPYIRKLKKGDIITYNVVYSNLNPEPLTDAMGELYVYFSPDQ